MLLTNLVKPESGFVGTEHRDGSLSCTVANSQRCYVRSEARRSKSEAFLHRPVVVL